MHTAAPSFWPLALPAVTVASGSLRPMIARSFAQALERGVRARMLVAVERALAPAREGTSTGTISCAKVPSLLRGHRAARASAAPARPARSARSHTARRRFSAVSIMPPGTSWWTPPAVTRGRRADPRAPDSAALHAPAHAGGVELRLAHALRATGQHELGGPRLDLHAGEHHRLQPGAAAAVDLQPGDLDRQAGVERRDTPQCGRLAVRVALAEDHVVDELRRERGAAHELLDHRRGQLVTGDVAVHAAEAANGGPQRFADHSLAHAESLDD